MSDIIAIKRSKAAEETMKRYFQTTNLLISHLKRESDKKMVYELVEEEADLNELLISSCAIHCYHNIGIRTKTEEQMVSKVENITSFELLQKKELFEELAEILSNSIHKEILLAEKSLEFEIQLIESLMKSDISEDNKFLKNFRTQIEKHLIQVLNEFSSVFWLDHVGELTGLTRNVKNEILLNSGKLKATSQNLEEKLLDNKYSDKYIELSSFFALENELKKRFEFKTIQDLKLKTYPLRKIISQIIAYRLDIYPISPRGLKYFQKASELKKEILDELKQAIKKRVTYQSLEKNILEKIETSLIMAAKAGPNNFVYFLKNMFEQYFENIYLLLNRFGISNVALFSHVLNYNMENFFRDTKMNNINKFSFKKIDSAKNPLNLVKRELNRLQQESGNILEIDMDNWMIISDPEKINLIQTACNNLNFTIDELRTFSQKKRVIDKIFRKKYPLKGPASCYALVYEIPEIIQNLSRQIYFTYFQKISRQIARVLESYIIVSEDKGKILFGLKRLLNTSSQNWIQVKIEELVIQRIMKRQRELNIIFHATRDPFFVNSFILARFLECNLQTAQDLLYNDPSPLYEGVLELTLPEDMISSVSYVFAFDLFHRLIDFQETKKFKKDQLKELQNQKNKQKHKTIVESQKRNTLNWLEKKITSALMSVTAISVNPTSLYWTEKDQKIVMENMIQHAKLDNRKICPHCGRDTTKDACPEHNESIEALPIDLLTQFFYFGFESIKKNWPLFKSLPYSRLYSKVEKWIIEVLSQRIENPDPREDSDEMIEGEYRFVANEIAKIIGKKLDQAIYKKFKTNLRKRKK